MGSKETRFSPVQQLLFTQLIPPTGSPQELLADHADLESSTNCLGQKKLPSRFIPLAATRRYIVRWLRAKSITIEDIDFVMCTKRTRNIAR